jgi:threonine aldolase
MYKISAGDVPLIDRLHPAITKDGEERSIVHRNPVREGEVYPATVVRVFSTNSQTANLRVHLDGDGTADYWATSRTEGENPGTWSWPPRV